MRPTVRQSGRGRYLTASGLRPQCAQAGRHESPRRSLPRATRRPKLQPAPWSPRLSSRPRVPPSEFAQFHGSRGPQRHSGVSGGPRSEPRRWCQLPRSAPVCRPGALHGCDQAPIAKPTRSSHCRDSHVVTEYCLNARRSSDRSRWRATESAHGGSDLHGRDLPEFFSIYQGPAGLPLTGGQSTTQPPGCPGASKLCLVQPPARGHARQLYLRVLPSSSGSALAGPLSPSRDPRTPTPAADDLPAPAYQAILAPRSPSALHQ